MSINIKLFRNGIESRYFTLNDTIGINVECEENSSVGIFIHDSKDRIRYRGFGSGKKLEFKTKIKYTDVYGTWKLVIVNTKTKKKRELLFKFVTPEEMQIQELIENARRRQKKPVKDLPKDSILRSIKAGWGVLLPKQKIHILAYPFLFSGFISSNPLIIEERVLKGAKEEKAHKNEKEEKEEEKSIKQVDLGVPVIELKGIGRTYETRLNRAGIFTTSQLIKYSPEKLAEITNARISRCKEWISQAKQIENEDRHPLRERTKSTLSTSNESISIEKVKGIGPTYARRLRSVGINTVGDLIKMEPEQIKEITKAPISRIHQWVTYSKQLLESKDITRKSDLDEQEDTDELIQIKGIGPITAKKLLNKGISSIRDLVLIDIEEIKPLIRGSPEKISVIIGNAFYALLIKNKDEALQTLKQLKEKDKTKQLEHLINKINEIDIAEAATIISEYKLKKFNETQKK